MTTTVPINGTHVTFDERTRLAVLKAEGIARPGRYDVKPYNPSDTPDPDAGTFKERISAEKYATRMSASRPFEVWYLTDLESSFYRIALHGCLYKPTE